MTAMKRIWNIVMGGIFHAHRYCPACGKPMSRVPATEESYIRQSTSYAMGSRNMGQMGGRTPSPGLRVIKKVQVIPVYDTCENCNQRIPCGSIKTPLS